MFVAEFNVLEMAFGEFLGSLLHIDSENGKILYLTPHTGYGRINILENQATESFTPVTLSDLRRYIIDLRNLTHDVLALTQGGYETLPPYTSRPAPPRDLATSSDVGS